MLKKILKFFLWLLLIVLICAGVIGYYIWQDKPLEDALLVLAGLAVLVILFLIVRRLIVRWRAKRQVKKLINEEQTETERLSWSPRVLRRDLRRRWRQGIRALKRSRLRLLGDPLYVLPWFVIMGRSRSGKSTAVKNAYLLSPVLDLPERTPGSTRNLDWWMYEEAIVIDTAGRYAVPDDAKRDRSEWESLLALLSRRKQREPLNGVVIVVGADRLLEAGADALLEEGRQVRASVGNLMNVLAAQVPVYLLVTKCDLVEGFTAFCEALPEENWQQVMGALNDQAGAPVNTALDGCFERLSERLRDLRLLLVDRSESPSVEMMFFPDALSKLRDGLHHFLDGALKGSPYLETPHFRGLFISSSQQALPGDKARKLKDRGLFLHDLFTKVLPADRGLLVTLPAAERLRRAVQRYWIGIAGGVLAVAGLLLTFWFVRDLHELYQIRTAAQPIHFVRGDVNGQVEALSQLDALSNEVDAAQQSWIVPWYGGFVSPQQHRMTVTYQREFSQDILDPLDRRLKQRLALVVAGDPAIPVLAEGLARRSLILQARMAGADAAALQQLAPVTGAYWRELQPMLGADTAASLPLLYDEYVAREDNPVALAREQDFVRNQLVELLRKTSGDYAWLLALANNAPGLESVEINRFWNGTRPVPDAAEVKPAFTAAGYALIGNVINELQQATAQEGSAPIQAFVDSFYEYYDAAYLAAWGNFAQRFDEGEQTLAGRTQWLGVVSGLAQDNPYFKLLAQMKEELAPLEGSDVELKTLVDYFADVQAFQPAEGAEGGGGISGKQASKIGTTLLKLFGKKGKQLAKAIKKGQKLAKGGKKKQTHGKSKEDMESAIGNAAKAYQDYLKAIGLLAFNSENRSESYANISALFGAPDKVASSGTSGGNAWTAVQALEMITGKPSPQTQAFWTLYTGPLRLSYDFMQRETACYLNDQWSSGVLAQTEGVDNQKLPNLLYGQNGLLWKFTGKTAAAFVANKYQAGYTAVRANDSVIPFTPGFMRYLNEALAGSKLVGDTFQVQMNALPTNVNGGAKITPSAVTLTLQCAAGVQELDNYNYQASQTFTWSVGSCGNAVLRIFIGPLVLTRVYTGMKAFPQLLEDFRDGEHIFRPADFPDDAAQLRHDGVAAIRVRYAIKGQRPVIATLKAVPLVPPVTVANCWAPNG
ncbi:MAG TPA: type VI secretion protein IcmF/TssM N-terminal domain-containing protein [Gammaproteobacteria bacterium]|nr:type VI secretion protein IcmF/TssM N-terminal domain-containing protein [Gammaproteobacteria bacterium]